MLADQSRLRLTFFWYLALLMFPVLLLQGWATRRIALRLPEASGAAAGEHGKGDRQLSIVGLGDSVIAGVGVSEFRQSVTACAATAIAERCSCRVQWQARGRNGDRLRDLIASLQSEPVARADIYLISIGVNDVTGLTGLLKWQLQMVELIGHFSHRSTIVMLAVPPMESFTALPEPLKWSLGVRAALLDKTLRQLDNAVSNVIRVGPRGGFDGSHLAEDGYHPNPVACLDIGAQIAEACAPRLKDLLS